MNNFTFYSPTLFAFGQGEASRVGALVRQFGGSKVLLVAGGGSVLKNGAYDAAAASLKEAGIPWCELWGVQANPRSGKVYEGISLARKEGVDFLLAIGGGSVIDTAKAIGMERLYREVLPANWVLYQVMTFVDANTFDMYAKNMGQIMMEKITNADLLVFNRCTDELKASLRKRNLRMVNRRADIYLEDLEGNSEDYNNGEICPFDLDQKVIDIPDNDYGVWYVDVMDYPDRWAGKTVHMKLLMCHSKKYPGTHCPGRFAMVCCENDVQFMGLVAKGMDLSKYKNRDWVEVEARMALENHPAYKGKGPVMHIVSIKPCEKPANEVVTF